MGVTGEAAHDRSARWPAGTGGPPLRVPGVGDTVSRVVRAELAAAAARRDGRPVRVLDAGGGSGAWAVPLAQVGCQVTVVDTSPNALAALRGRARDAGVADRITPVQADVTALGDVVATASADLVLGHGLLEVVDLPGTVLAQLAGATAPGGAVSVLVAGRHGTALSLARAGRLAQARAVLTDPAGRSGPNDPLQRRLDLAGVRRLLETDAGLDVELVAGDGLVDSWLPADTPGRVDRRDPARGHDPAGVAQFTSLLSDLPELLVLASRLHALARRSRP